MLIAMKERARGVTLWFPDPLRDLLEQYARRYGVTLSVVVRELIEAGMHERLADLEADAWRTLYGSAASERLKVLRWGRLSAGLSLPEVRLILQEWYGVADGAWASRTGNFLPFNEVDRSTEELHSLAHYRDVRGHLAWACSNTGALGYPDLAVAVTSSAQFYVEAYAEVRGGQRVLTQLGRIIVRGTYQGYRWPGGAFSVAWPNPADRELEVPIPERLTPEIAEELFAYPLALGWVQAWRELTHSDLVQGEIPDPLDVSKKMLRPVPAFVRLTIAEPEGRGRTQRWRLWKDDLLLPTLAELPSWGPALVERELGLSIDEVGALIRQDMERKRAFYEVFEREDEWRGRKGEPYGPYVLRPYWEQAEHLRERLVAHGWDPVTWALDWMPCVKRLSGQLRLASSLYRRFYRHYGTPVAFSEYASYPEAELIRRALVHQLQQKVWEA